MSSFFMVLSQPGTVGPIVLSLKTACVVTPLLAIFGIGLGYSLGRWRSPLASIVDFLITLPLIFPPIATGFLLLLLLGRRGPFGEILSHAFGLDIVFSFWGVSLASFVAGLPLIVKPVQASLRREIGRYIEAAQILGKSRITIFFRIVLPLLRKNIGVGLFLALARSMGDVGITLMLGGNIVGKTNTVSLEIYNAVFTGDYERAFILVIILGVVSLALVAATRRLSAE
ncbi:molybdate ABC transporter permease subunit [Desulfovibrio inopinatus]|uniref:molybdate ABC transporter permease subunit n=1 Tax=Desulfovibrio inopinatus TaxID=102109 RepID=UPI000412373D|nr:ABC transporter permease subunit [Desulfovibrio inopinatus]